MPAFMPAEALGTAVGLATAAMHIDEPGGREKLTELVDGLTAQELQISAIVLARLLALHCDDRHLQEIGVQCLDGGVVAP
jgi:hypothetical protein